ncbi:g5365 [Coccomyxa viridis]|uniref:G5365 protein n=1 Tax=Coccomyxa viridis TaxID=1274662 RepID=A0ABP1FWL2_9CHLO
MILVARSTPPTPQSTVLHLLDSAPQTIPLIRRQSTDFYLDQRSKKFYKPGIPSEHPVPENAKCHADPSQEPCHEAQYTFPKDRRWVQRSEPCWWQIIIVLALACAAFYYAQCRSESLRLAAGTGGPDKAKLRYARAVFSTELFGMVTLLFYAVHTTFKPSPFIPRHAERGATPCKPALKYIIRVLIPCYTESDHTIQQTVRAAVDAPEPEGCIKHVYMCNDSSKSASSRSTWVRETFGEDKVHHVSRPSQRPKTDANPKSVNLNWALNQIYGGLILGGRRIPDNEIICILDCDQIVHSDFFKRTVHLMDGGLDVGLVLTPQPFVNISPAADIFGHCNAPFWYIMQPFYQILGLISCTGTNFLLRAEAWRQCDGFPTYTLTEDFALGLELTLRGWKCRYIPDELVSGDAPRELSKVLKQRGRWAQGHFQMFWHPWYNPLCRFVFRKASPLRYAHGLLLGLWYCTGVLAYCSTILCAPILVIVPLLNFWTGVFPIVLSRKVAAAATAYLALTLLVIFHCPRDKMGNMGYIADGKSKGASFCYRIRALWQSNMSSNLLWVCYLQAAVMAALATAFNFKLKWAVTGARGSDKKWSPGDILFPLIAYTALLVSLFLAILAMVVEGGQYVPSANANDTNLADHLGPLNPALGISIGWSFYALIPSVLYLLYLLGEHVPCSCCLCCMCCCPDRRPDAEHAAERGETRAEQCGTRFHDNLLGLSVCLAMPLSILALLFTTIMLVFAVYKDKQHGTGLPFSYEGWLGVYFLFRKGDPQDALRPIDH